MITSAVPAREVAYEVAVEEGAIRVRGEIELTAIGGGTRIRWRETGDFGWNPLLGYLADGWGRCRASSWACRSRRSAGSSSETSVSRPAEPEEVGVRTCLAHDVQEPLHRVERTLSGELAPERVGDRQCLRTQEEFLTPGRRRHDVDRWEMRLSASSLFRTSSLFPVPLNSSKMT